MKNNELYVISDLNGRPLFFITESNEIDFRLIISRVADKLIELGITRAILVFNRAGYSVHFSNNKDKPTSADNPDIAMIKQAIKILDKEIDDSVDLPYFL